MKVEEILAGIDQEIARLQHARNLLAGDQPRRGRPRGSTSAKKAAKRQLSPQSPQVVKSGDCLRKAASALPKLCGNAGQSARRHQQSSKGKLTRFSLRRSRRSPPSRRKRSGLRFLNTGFRFNERGQPEAALFCMITEFGSLASRTECVGYKSRLIHALTRLRRHNLDPRTFQMRP